MKTSIGGQAGVGTVKLEYRFWVHEISPTDGCRQQVIGLSETVSSILTF